MRCKTALLTTELDPHSYSTYYKRATAYLSLGRNSAALDDFDRILKMNPAFIQVCWYKIELTVGVLSKSKDIGQGGRL